MRTRLLILPLVAALAGASAGTAHAQSAPDIDSIVTRVLPAPVVAANAPGDVSDGFSVTTSAGPLRITPLGTAAAHLRQSPAGRAVYPDAYRAATTVFQHEDDRSARVLNVLADSRAPREYGWDVDLPAGATLAPQPDGTIGIFGNGVRIGSVAPAWAVDGAGRPVPTHYTVNGARLTQVVEHAGAHYPVVADPRWAWG